MLTQPWLHQITQLDAIHGTGRISAQDIIAKIGTGMSVFPTAAHLASRARWCPQARQSGGRHKPASTGRGNPYLSAAPAEIAISAGRTQSFPGTRYQRLVKRMPQNKALAATGNSIPAIIHTCCPTPPPPTTISAPATTSSA